MCAHRVHRNILQEFEGRKGGGEAAGEVKSLRCRSGLRDVWVNEKISILNSPGESLPWVSARTSVNIADIRPHSFATERQYEQRGTFPCILDFDV